MNKIKDFTDKERKDYGKVFTDLNFAMSNISDFINEDTKKNKKFITKLPVLKKYLEMIDTADREADRKDVFDVFRSDEKYKIELEDYKVKFKKELNQLCNCSKCICANCVQDCDYDSCLGCRSGAKISFCDKAKINLISHSDFFLDLTNDKTGINNRYHVLATLQDVELDRRYIIIQNVQDENDKFILYWYPNISGDTYGEITDGEEFDFIVSTFESVL